MSTMLFYASYSYMMKSLEKLGFLSIRASVMAFLILWKACFASIDQENWASFFNIVVIREIIFEKSLMNFLTKFTWPKKDYRAFLLEGIVSNLIALTLSESIAKPSPDTMWPINFP